jgi:hypothetical protein
MQKNELNETIMENKIINLSLKELSEIEDLSVRTMNVCICNDLLDLNSLLDFLLKNRNFRNIKNCGIKTHLQLLDICNKYGKNSNTEDKIQKLMNLNTHEIEDKVKNTSNIDIPILSLEEISSIEDLDIRTKNICWDNKLLDLNSILDHYRVNGTFLNIIKCGKKSDSKLRDICKKYSVDGSL